MEYMALILHNSLSREDEVFTPQNPKEVTLYTCGPTVYNYPHIGNYRAYIFADILKRTLIYSGYNVNHIMNITDIDDKTIRDSQKEGKTLKEFTEFYTEEFMKDVDTLHILRAGKYTKATEYVNEMVEMIETLIEKGHAYKSDDGSVYFNIKSFPEYGKLTHLKLDALEENAGGRIKKDEYDKDNAQDFALWKAWDETDGDVFWETSLGKGRPGWHIECSAMSTKTLGDSIDIHTGGIDNMFPHHENEIAQSECATGKSFVKYWLHNAWLLVEGKKMAKSAGNFYTLRDLEKIDVTPLGFRYWLMTAKYNTPINFTIDALHGAQKAFKRLGEAYLSYPEGGTVAKSYKDAFTEAIENDLGTPKALALIWELIADDTVSPADKKMTLLDFDTVFGFGLNELQKEEKADIEIPHEVIMLMSERAAARLDKEYALSDILRAKIETYGFTIKDIGDEQKISKL